MRSNRRAFLKNTGSATLVAMSGLAIAADYPVRPVRIIVPYGAGSAADVITRTVAEGLTKLWSQQVVIDNRPGASGIIGLQELKKSKTEGYDIAFGDMSGLAINPHIFPQLPYDSQRDFTQIVDIFWSPMVAWVSKDSPFATLQQFVDAAKAAPGKLNFASTGLGSPTGMAAELLKYEAGGLKLEEIPFKEVGPLLSAVVNNEVNIFFTSPPTVRSVIDRLRPLAVTSARRLPEFPAVPTVEEAIGRKGFEYTVWTTFLAPKGTPNDVTQIIRSGVIEVFKRPDIREKMKFFSAEGSRGLNSEELATLLAGSSEKYKAILASRSK